MTDKILYDCIIVGAGPGGLQAAIHLARYNRRVLIIDRGGGRTTHARHIVNYLGLQEIPGRELVAEGLEQAKGFGAEVIKDTVARVEKKDVFIVHLSKSFYLGSYVIVSTGAVDKQPPLKNLGRFFGKGYYTCIDCDGHLTTGRKLLVMGNSMNAIRLVFAMRQMYSEDISILLTDFEPPPDSRELVEETGIPLYFGEPVALLGEDDLEGVQLADGRTVKCQAIMASFGWHLNDNFLRDLPLDRDAEKFKILTNSTNESSLKGLYVVGAMRTGHSQAIIAAGQGAVTAIDINQRLLAL